MKSPKNDVLIKIELVFKQKEESIRERMEIGGTDRHVLARTNENYLQINIIDHPKNV